jgi:hypothetical protein
VRPGLWLGPVRRPALRRVRQGRGRLGCVDVRSRVHGCPHPSARAADRTRFVSTSHTAYQRLRPGGSPPGQCGASWSRTGVPGRGDDREHECRSSGCPHSSSLTSGHAGGRAVDLDLDNGAEGGGRLDGLSCLSRFEGGVGVPDFVSLTLAFGTAGGRHRSGSSRKSDFLLAQALHQCSVLGVYSIDRPWLFGRSVDNGGALAREVPDG